MLSSHRGSIKRVTKFYIVTPISQNPKTLYVYTNSNLSMYTRQNSRSMRQCWPCPWGRSTDEAADAGKGREWSALRAQYLAPPSWSFPAVPARPPCLLSAASHPSLGTLPLTCSTLQKHKIKVTQLAKVYGLKKHCIKCEIVGQMATTSRDAGVKQCDRIDCISIRR
jgi:hypothetical protein